MSFDDKRAVQRNLAHWEAISREHIDSPFYLYERVLKGASSLSSTEEAELGQLQGLSGLHFQCGLGLETVSIERLGADVIGLDFAESAIRLARELASRCNAKCRFMISDVLNQNDLPGGEFDFVYASHGVLRWIPNISLWMSNAAKKLRVGGFLYLFEIHPLVYRLTSANAIEVGLKGNYFDEQPREKAVTATHIGLLPADVPDIVVHTDWKLSSIVNAAIESGLTISFLREHDECSYTRKGLISKRHDTLWKLPGDTPIPLAYSLRATRTI